MPGFVSDSGPFITWARAGRTSLLRQVVGHVFIPPAVAQELQPSGPPRAGSDLLQEGWIQVVVLIPGALPTFPSVLGDGEREAILLARQMRSTLIVDDYPARDFAEKLGIPILTSLRILAQCKHLGLISEAAPVLEQFVRDGFWLSKAVQEKYLKQLGETPL